MVKSRFQIWGWCGLDLQLVTCPKVAVKQAKETNTSDWYQRQEFWTYFCCGESQVLLWESYENLGLFPGNDRGSFVFSVVKYSMCGTCYKDYNLFFHFFDKGYFFLFLLVFFFVLCFIIINVPSYFRYVSRYTFVKVSCGCN